MRVQLITHSYLPERTPPQRRWEAFVAAFREAGWEVDIVAPRADPHHVPGGAADPAATQRHSDSGPRGERILRTPTIAALGRSRDGRFAGHIVHALTAIPRSLAAERPDVLVITVPALPTAVAGWLTSRMRRVPLIVEMRDAWPDLARESGVATGLLSRLMEAVLTATQQSAEVVVTVTRGFAVTLRERGLESVEVIGNGVEVERMPSLPLRDRPAGELHVLYLGNHGESQSLETVIRAAAQARRRHPGIRMRMAGSGTQKDNLARLNESLGSPVEMLDPVHGRSLQELYAWSDTCVISLRSDWPSFERTVPSKAYELLSIGRHVTAAVTGEAAEVLSEAGTATVVPLDAAVLADLWVGLADDPATTRVGDSGRDWVRQHADLGGLGRAMVDLSGEVAERTGGTARRRSSRLRQWADNAALTATTVLHHVNDDPAVFALQVSRRLPPALRRLIPESGGSSATGMAGLASALALAVSGRTDALAERTRRAIERGEDPAVLSRYADIAVATGQTALAEDVLAQVPAATSGRRTAQARLEWDRGDMTAAVETLGTSGRQGRLRRRFEAERASYRGAAPTAGAVAGYRPASDRRILHVLTNSLPHTGSGYAQRSHHILRSLADRGWEVSAVTRIGWPVQTGILHAAPMDVVDGIRYHRILPARLAEGFDERLQQQTDLLVELARRERPALLHTTSHWVNGLVVRAAAEALGIPWVYEVRGQLGDTWASSRGEEAYASERYRLFNEREAEVVRSADGLVTLGENLRSALVTQGAEADAVVLSPNAVGGDFLAEPGSREQARRRLGLDPTLEYVGTVSSIVPYEGLDTLVRAVARLAPQRPDLRLLLVGDGVSLPGLLELAEQLGISERVVAPGRVDRGTSMTWHHALDVFVVPRQDTRVTRTVTPMKSMEASASARPVIASDLPALRELVEDGATGLLVPPGDVQALSAAMAGLLDDPVRARRLGAAGREWVLAERTWGANAERYAHLYGRLLDPDRVAARPTR